MGPTARDTSLTFRVTLEEAARLKELAWRERVRLSSWLRELALREADRVERRRRMADRASA
jgi:hypothetical protein